METFSVLNAYYKATFDAFPAPALLLKPDYPFFTVVDANEKYLQLTSFLKEDLIGTSLLSTTINPDDERAEEVLRAIVEVLRQTVEQKKPVEQEMFRFDIKSPQKDHYIRKFWTATNTPILDENGDVAMILHTPVDVTEIQELQEREESIQKVSDRQNEFFQSIFFQAPVAIGVFDSKDFIIKQVNPELAAFYNMKVPELLGKKVFEVFPEAKELWGPILTKVMSTGEPYKGFEVEVDLSLGDKKKVSYVNFAMVPHHDLNGKISGVICVSVDVTEHVELRKTVEENELMMKIAAESAKLGIWDISLETQMVYSSSYLWMPGFPLKKVNFSIEEFVEYIIPEDRIMVLKAVKQTKDHFTIQARVRWQDSSIHWLQLTGIVLRDRQAKANRIIGTTLDITERKELEKRKDELISTVSHELKTPVTSIKAIAQILNKKFSSSEDTSTSELLNKLVNHIKRLTTLIHDLLDASLIEGGKLQLKKSNFMFNELVEEVVMELERTFPTHRIILENTPVIRCFNDKERLRQVLVNLISNAVKYSPGRDKVLITVESGDDYITCCVRDFGVGIPQEKASQIFDRFYRIVDEKHYGFQGIGIGLYITKQIIDRLGGKIWFDSVPDEGTTFCFKVPCIKPT